MDCLNNISCKELLKRYLSFISHFEKNLRAEKSIPETVNVWSFMVDNSYTKGTAGSFTYERHGSGFTAKKDSIICEYDKAPLNEYEVKFSIWKFRQFIETQNEQINIEEDILEKKLLNLVDTNILKWLIIDDINWNIYQTHLDIIL